MLEILTPTTMLMPERLAQSAWHEHVPFAFWLVDALRPKTIVELGVDYGVSLSAFNQAVTAIGYPAKSFGVDTWQGDPHARQYGEDVYSDLCAFHLPRFGNWSTLLRMTFQEARPQFESGSVQLLHIDGYHTYEAVKEDFETWKDTLSDGGIILFHDTFERGRDFGVWKLWEELSATHRSFEFQHGHGLGVLGIGSQFPERIDRLFSLSEEETALTRRTFHYLGTLQLIRFERMILEQKLAESSATREEDRARLLQFEEKSAQLLKQLAELQSGLALSLASHQAANQHLERLLIEEKRRATLENVLLAKEAALRRTESAYRKVCSEYERILRSHRFRVAAFAADNLKRGSVSNLLKHANWEELRSDSRSEENPLNLPCFSYTTVNGGYRELWSTSFGRHAAAHPVDLDRFSKSVRFTIQTVPSRLRTLDLIFGTYGRRNDVSVEVRILLREVEIFQVTLDGSLLIDNAWHRIELGRFHDSNALETLEVEVRSPNPTVQQHVALWCSSDTRDGALELMERTVELEDLDESTLTFFPQFKVLCEDGGRRAEIGWSSRILPLKAARLNERGMAVVSFQAPDSRVTGVSLRLGTGGGSANSKISGRLLAAAPGDPFTALEEFFFQSSWCADNEYYCLPISNQSLSSLSGKRVRIELTAAPSEHPLFLWGSVVNVRETPAWLQLDPHNGFVNKLDPSLDDAQKFAAWPLTNRMHRPGSPRHTGRMLVAMNNHLSVGAELQTLIDECQKSGFETAITPVTEAAVRIGELGAVDIVLLPDAPDGEAVARVLPVARAAGALVVSVNAGKEPLKIASEDSLCLLTCLPDIVKLVRWHAEHRSQRQSSGTADEGFPEQLPSRALRGAPIFM